MNGKSSALLSKMNLKKCHTVVTETVTETLPEWAREGSTNE